jgi:sporulation protein YlmC with PRC-barrel domain
MSPTVRLPTLLCAKKSWNCGGFPNEVSSNALSGREQEIYCGPQMEESFMTKLNLKYGAATLAASALLLGTAIAQTTPPAPPAPPAPAAQTTPTTAPAATQQTSGQWRGSKLIGLDIYNNNNEKIGDVSEIITNANGQIEAVVVGVGGFLGLGQHDVALKWSDLRFVNEAPRSSTTTTTPPANANRAPNATTPPATTTTTTTANAEAPNHAVVNMTADQLKAMPAFKYAGSTTTTR